MAPATLQRMSAAVLFLVCAPAWARQISPAVVDRQVQALTGAHPSLVEVSRIGVSRQGRPLHLIRLADRGATDPAPADRPALVVVAGAGGMHRVGVQTALGVAAKLASEHAESLKAFTVYVIPCLNPDSLAYHAEARRPAVEFARTIWPYDADRDGRVNEDPGEDLDGDGVIAMMRIADPRPGSGLKAEYAADADDPRLLKRADASKGETARYALLIEGTDNDGDGKFNEDGPGGTGGGGVDLDMNTPYRWPEFSDGSGPFQFSEPESLALATWLLGQRGVVAVLYFGPHDNLVNIPPTGKFDEAGSVPVGIEAGDKTYHEEISKVFKEITRMTGAPTPDTAGSLHGWTYAMYGAHTFTTPVWVRPDLVKAEKPAEKKEEEKKEEGGRGAGADAVVRPVSLVLEENQPAGGGRGGRGMPGRGAEAQPATEARKVGDTDDAKWLKYSDEQRGGEGFIDWKPFDHPQLGPVEIGGFVPGFKVNPPEEELARLADEQTRFVAALLGKLPRLTGPRAEVTRLGNGLWRVAARVTNDGYLPLQPAMGVKTRRVAPSVLLIDLPQDRIVSGSKLVRFPSLEGSGAAADAEWIVRADDGSTVKVQFRPAVGPVRSLDVVLQESSR